MEKYIGWFVNSSVGLTLANILVCRRFSKHATLHRKITHLSGGTGPRTIPSIFDVAFAADVPERGSLWPFESCPFFQVTLR